MLATMASMFGMARQDARLREDASRSEIQATMQIVIQNMGNNAAGMTSQVKHVSNTVKKLHHQVYANADFTIDAVQQVRDELNARIDAYHDHNTH